ncbi:hypothetical protein L218DRAFT_917502 [Marasmius fiardii PR-910]|nr:hypothetical protein L218DRAFT_917502 [Marasmius fiardii PR-910]
MAFGLTIGTERATILQQAIQDELIARGYSQDPDPVMAEYITIMVINNKTAAQITGELEDLIGPDFDGSFTDWLFSEATKNSAEVEPSVTSPEQPVEQSAPQELPSQPSTSRSSNAPRNGVYQQALSQALPHALGSSQKRTASARSPSPNHPNKIRRTDVPTGPRAMQRDGSSNPRSLLDRVSGASSHNTHHNQHDEIQARIDNITNGPGAPGPNVIMQNGFPGMNMDMNPAMAMGNPMMLQEIMMNQMALMAQITGMMGSGINSGFPMMPGDMAMLQQQQNTSTNGFQGGSQGSQRGRGGARGGRGVGRGRGGSPASGSHKADATSASPEIQPIPAAIPTQSIPGSIIGPVVAPTSTSAPTPVAPPKPTYALPERPQSPTLCKFGLNCTNPHCRWSHPSPVATVESGVVLSNDPCENGKGCKDKDCIKAHVSPAVLKPQAEQSAPPATTPQPPPTNVVPCRFGASCTRPNCSFSHPPRPSSGVNHFAQQCRFGAACTRATCPFQHPESRVLPNTFHRGLSTTSPLVNIKTPETGSMGGASPHKSVTFKNPGGPSLEEKLKEIEQRKLEAEKKVKEAEAAAAKDNKSVAITA